ncbi:MAG: 50S ribosomal protein L18e [Candidatus Nanohaloarchaea archaeon]|nr:50S ribosomal protein L18e [Candidatus Nanohaloarchaea archaeon]
MQKTNPVLQRTIKELEEAGRKNDAPVYERAAEELSQANRRQVEVNLSRIERNAEDSDTVLVPGKVLGSGFLDTDVTVAAFDFSRSAREAIEETGETKFVEDLVDENPDGAEVQLIA